MINAFSKCSYINVCLFRNRISGINFPEIQTRPVEIARLIIQLNRSIDFIFKSAVGQMEARHESFHAWKDKGGATLTMGSVFKHFDRWNTVQKRWNKEKIVCERSPKKVFLMYAYQYYLWQTFTSILVYTLTNALFAMSKRYHNREDCSWPLNVLLARLERRVRNVLIYSKNTHWKLIFVILFKHFDKFYNSMILVKGYILLSETLVYPIFKCSLRLIK